MIGRTIFLNKNPKRKSWGRGSAERICGNFFLAWRILGELPANFSANFDCRFFLQIFRPCFSTVSGLPPKNSRPKFTPEIVAIPLQFHFLEPKMFSRRFSAYGGDQKFRSEKLNECCPNCSNFQPEFCPNLLRIFPKFLEEFFLLRFFLGNGDQKKNHQKSAQFFNANFPA